MKKEELQEKWQTQSEAVLSGIAEWREQHPVASLAEIEAEIDERLAGLRARMIADAALASRSVEWKKGEPAGQCPVCGYELVKKGKKKRALQTRGGKEIELDREYGQCQRCGAKIFPPG